MNLNHAGQQRELYCKLILPCVSSWRFKDTQITLFVRAEFGLNIKSETHGLKKSDLETLSYKIKWF